MNSERSGRGARRPSPALIVSIVALVVACSGTAVAAGVFIKHSSQLGKSVVTSSAIKNHTIQGGDIHNGAIGGHQIKNGSVSPSKLSKSAKSGPDSLLPAAFEAYHRDGPSVPSGAMQKIATLSNLPAGRYAIFAKTVAGRLAPPRLPQAVNTSIVCDLDAAGDHDRASGPISSAGASNEASLEMQITRSFSSPSDVSLSCEANADFHAGTTSIIAISLATVTRTSVDD